MIYFLEVLELFYFVITRNGHELNYNPNFLMNQAVLMGPDL